MEESFLPAHPPSTNAATTPDPTIREYGSLSIDAKKCPVVEKKQSRQHPLRRLVSRLLCMNVTEKHSVFTPRTSSMSPSPVKYSQSHPNFLYQNNTCTPLHPAADPSSLPSVSARKALFSTRSHTKKVEFFHELPVAIVLYITQFLELQLTHRPANETRERSNSLSSTKSSYTSSPIFKQICGVFRPWGISRVIFSNVVLDMKIYNKKSDLKCLTRHVKRLRIVGGKMKGDIIRQLICQSNIEYISLSISDKGCRKLMGYCNSANDECVVDDEEDTSSAVSRSTRSFTRQCSLVSWNISGSSLFKNNTTQSSVMEFPRVLRAYSGYFCNLNSFYANNCPGLNGKQIAEIIRALIDIGAPIRHFSVSPSENAQSNISIDDYIGIKNWKLESLSLYVTPSNIADTGEKRVQVDSKDALSILHPMRYTLRKISCNLNSESISFLFDSSSFAKLSAISLSQLFYDDNLHMFVTTKTPKLKTLEAEVKDTLCIKLLKNFPNLERLTIRNEQVGVELIKSLTDLSQLHTLQFTHHYLPQEFCQILFKIVSLRDLILRDKAFRREGYKKFSRLL